MLVFWDGVGHRESAPKIFRMVLLYVKPKRNFKSFFDSENKNCFRLLMPWIFIFVYAKCSLKIICFKNVVSLGRNLEHEENCHQLEFYYSCKWSCKLLFYLLGANCWQVWSNCVGLRDFLGRVGNFTWEDWVYTFLDRLMLTLIFNIAF